MIVYCDSLHFGNILFPENTNAWEPLELQALDTQMRFLAGRIFLHSVIYRTEVDMPPGWKYLLAAEFAPESQFGILEKIGREEAVLPDGLICLAGSGQNFKGYRKRRWVSLPGNLHLTAFQAPMKPLHRFNSAFMILSAVSALEAIDTFPALNRKTGIKWVNDIILGKAKVGGVLTYSQTQAEQVTGVLSGVGINVQTKPILEEDIFVPEAAALGEYTEVPLNRLLSALLKRMDYYYRKIFRGGYDELLDIYRQRSLVIGRHIIVYSDPLQGQPAEIARGKVTAIGPDLELYIHGLAVSVRSGRVVLTN